MTFKAVLLLYFVSVFNLFAQDGGGKMLPVLMESNDSTVKYEFEYDFQNRITSTKSTIFTPMNKVLIINSNRLTYYSDSLITVDYRQTANDEEVNVSNYRFLISKDTIQVVASDNQKREMSIDEKGRLLKSKFIKDDITETISLFEYDYRGNLSKTVTCTKDYNMQSRITYAYTYLPKDDKNDIFSFVNNPLWLQHYLLGSLIPSFNKTEFIDIELLTDDAEPSREQIKVSYQYNDNNYPILITVDTESCMKITYKEAN